MMGSGAHSREKRRYGDLLEALYQMMGSGARSREKKRYGDLLEALC